MPYTLAPTPSVENPDLRYLDAHFNPASALRQAIHPSLPSQHTPMLLGQLLLIRKPRQQIFKPINRRRQHSGEVLKIRPVRRGWMASGRREHFRPFETPR